LGFPLPESSTKHRSWWANDKKHIQAIHGYLDHGCEVDSIDFTRKIAIFHKVARKDQKREHAEKKPDSPITPID
jgi:hypothetical protein